MEIHWVSVVAKLQWRGERAEGGGQLARASFVSLCLLWSVDEESSDQRRMLTCEKQERLLK